MYISPPPQKREAQNVRRRINAAIYRFNFLIHAPKQMQEKVIAFAQDGLLYCVKLCLRKFSLQGNGRYKKLARERVGFSGILPSLMSSWISALCLIEARVFILTLYGESVRECSARLVTRGKTPLPWTFLVKRRMTFKVFSFGFRLTSTFIMEAV